MPKKDKKEKARPKKLEEASHDSAASEEVPYVETLREKFMQNHDETIMLRPEERLSLEWRQMTYRVPIVKRTCCKVKERTEKVILNDVSGYLPAGSLLVRLFRHTSLFWKRPWSRQSTKTFFFVGPRSSALFLLTNLPPNTLYLSLPPFPLAPQNRIYIFRRVSSVLAVPVRPHSSMCFPENCVPKKSPERSP